MPVNKEHLLKIKQHILEDPERLYMADWILNEEPGTLVSDSYVSSLNRFDQEVPVCGTVACIAGWSAVLRGLKDSEVYQTDEQRFLGVTNDLFFPDQWPLRFYKRYQDSTDAKEKALVVADVIDHVIEHDGQFDYSKDV